jgi:hypothetical protein
LLKHLTMIKDKVETRSAFHTFLARFRYR